MSSPRHILWFFYLGLSWGVVPVLYRLLADARMPVSHTVFLSGIGVGIFLCTIDAVRKGTFQVSRSVLAFSIFCAILANGPFALNLTAAKHVPPAMLAMIVSTTPLVNYLVALLTGWEEATLRRLLAIALGFISTLMLILPDNGSRQQTEAVWIIAAMALPFFYCLYGYFAALKWPRGADAGQVAAIESGLGGLFAMPMAFAFAPFATSGGPELSAYWLIVAAVAMWIFERIAYFTLIKEKGAVYTGQASYVATPAAVIMSSVMFGGVTDVWLWLSLTLLMAALYLNNSGRNDNLQDKVAD